MDFNILNVNKNENQNENVCRNFMNRNCQRINCKYLHVPNLCKYFWKHGNCKFGDQCKFMHTYTQKQPNQQNIQPNQKREGSDRQRRRRVKNTECFEPMTDPVDMRVVMDLGDHTTNLTTGLTSRDVLLVPNLFRDFAQGELYSKLVDEINNCKVPKDELLKLWHGNDVIEGTHYICNDRTAWKRDCPTFSMVIKRLTDFFKMDVKATRLNWYTTTEQWKAFHKDSAAVKPEKAKTQNFTVAVSFGATRDCAFERDDSSKNVISFPIGDGEIYCFLNDTNCIWRHGVLQERPFRDSGRISIICWSWVDDVVSIS